MSNPNIDNSKTKAKLEQILKYEQTYQKDLRELGRAPSAQDYQRLFKSLEDLLLKLTNDLK